MTEADFKKPLLDADEERLVRELRGESDFSVDGLASSVLGRLINLFAGGRR